MCLCIINLCSGCVGWSAFCLICDACRCCVFVSCMHPVAVLNAAFCVVCGGCKRLPHG